MDVSTDRSTRTSPPLLQSAPAETLRLPRRRRPTGEAPPLPYHLQTSGVRWLIVGIVLMALTIVVFARGMRGLAVLPMRVVDRRGDLRARLGLSHGSQLLGGPSWPTLTLA